MSDQLINNKMQSKINAYFKEYEHGLSDVIFRSQDENFDLNLEDDLANETGISFWGGGYKLHLFASEVEAEKAWQMELNEYDYE